MKRLQIGHIIVTEDGTYWVYWKSMHPGQGGVFWEMGNAGAGDIQTLLKMVADSIEPHKARYLEDLKRIIEEKEGEGL